MRARLPEWKTLGRTLRLGATGLLAAAGLVAPGHGQVWAQPARVDRHAAIYDSARDRTVLFGGYDGANRSNQTWALGLAEGARWDSLTSIDPSPSARFGHSAIYDPVRGRMMVFGGTPEPGVSLNDTWTLSLASPSTWTQLSPTGTLPSARLYSTAIFDPVRDRMLIFGGASSTFLNDVWALSLGSSARWDSLPVNSGSLPAARQGHSAIYDPLRDRMIVFGGLFASRDVWQLSFADTAWSRITTLGTAPSARSGHSAIYDPAGDRMIVFGGLDGSGQRLNDVYELSFHDPPTWSRLDPAGEPPTPRFYHSAVHDSSRHAMVVFGGDHPGTDDTWALSLGQPPLWSPARPVLTVSTNDLQFASVTLGDTVSVPFSIANTGLEPLNISAIRLPFGEMSLGSPAPLRLAWRASVAETLVLAASEPRTNDSLVIESDDPLIPRKAIPLRIDVHGLEFASRVLGSPSEVPLGSSFIVIVTPDNGVRVERGTLFYRNAGTPAAFDSVALTPLATDFIGAVPAGAVTESGVEYYIRVENSGYHATHPAGAPSAAVFTPVVAAPSSVRAVPRPTSGSDFLAGRDIEVETILPAGADFVSGRIHFREGGAKAYETDTLTTDVLGRPVALVPGRVAGPRGVEFWIEARTLRSDLRFPAIAADPAIVRIKVQSLTEPTAHAGRRFRLLSVPLDFGVDFAGSLDGILSDQLGTYDPVRWRAFSYDPDSLQNLEFSASRATAFRPKPGRAFWLISREAHLVNTNPIDGFSTVTGRPYPIVLAPGWNLFGNPFDFPVAWSEVSRNPARVGTPVAFDPALGVVGDYSEATPTTLAPFEGYFIENVGAGPETLWVPPRATPEPVPSGDLLTRRSTPTMTSSPDADAAGANPWSIRLGARAEQAFDGSNEFGVDPQAADDFDALDVRKPPIAPGPWVQLAFDHRDWDPMPGLYRRDLRGPGSDGHTWEVELRSATANEPVTIELSATVALPSGLRVRIVDREQGNLADLSLDAQPAPNAPSDSASGTAAIPTVRYPILSLGPGRAYRLAIVVGTEEYVTRVSDQARVVPTRLTLEHNAPNPFRTATRIRFGLPHSARVNAEIYSVLGERVATLVDHATLDPGQHAVVWDGRTARGNPAPSGVYLLRLVADGDAVSRRILLVR